MQPYSPILLVAGAAVIIVAAIISLCVFFLRMGFRMGRQTVDKPPDVAKQYSPGEPVLDEPDPWDQAVEGSKKSPDIPEDIQ